MPFTYRDKPKLSDRFRGKSGEELLNELASDLDHDRRMFFDAPSWRQRQNNSSRFSRPFQGFPFADDRKRTDIRTYLDEIAARHPEFADQLKEPPWDEELNASVGGQDRGVDPEGNDYSQPGSSGVQHQQGPPQQSPQPGAEEVQEPRQNLSNFGLRNTVPLGPGALIEEDRHQRSMSAPPDNRPADKPKKFVTKCEIPIMHDPSQESGPPKSDPSMHQNVHENVQQKGSNAPNVRVIPIQVEGRDAPLLNTNFDTSTNYGQDSPRDGAFEGRLPRDFGAYQRHSPRFGHKERSATPPHQQYAPHYQQYVPPHQHFSAPQHQTMPQQQFQQQYPPQYQQQQHHPRHVFNQQSQRPPHPKQQQYQQSRPYSPQQQHHQYRPQHQHQQHHPQQQQQQQQPQYHPQQQQQQPQQAPPNKHSQGDATDSRPAQVPPPKQEPKDPIEKVHVIQKEVEELMKQVESFNGSSRTDKQYLMLDELLTRQLLLLDNIDTEGKENVRQARKDTIKSIQRCISTLENKVPLVDGNPEGNGSESNGGQTVGDGVPETPQAMDVDKTKENTPVDGKEGQNMEVDSQGGEKVVAKEGSAEKAVAIGGTTESGAIVAGGAEAPKESVQ